MSLPDTPSSGTALVSPALRSRRAALLARLAVVGLLSGGLAGCFQPMYAENSTVGGPALQEKLQDVEVVMIQGRLGNDLRNALIYDLTGGAGNPKGAPLQLLISVETSSSTALVNSSSGLPENQVIRVGANWRLVKAGDEKKKPLAQGQASGTTTIDVSDQRYANYAARKNAEERAGSEVAAQIKVQLADYFIRNPNGVPAGGKEPTKTPGS